MVLVDTSVWRQALCRNRPSPSRQAAAWDEARTLDGALRDIAEAHGVGWTP